MPKSGSRQNKSLLEAILETAAGAIIAIDARGIIEQVNPATERLFGYAQDEMIGRNVAMLMPEPDHSRHDGYMHHHMTTGEKRIIGIGRETSARRKDGSVFPIHLSVSAFVVDGERYFAGIIHDLSARTRLEAEIDRQALLFQTVFDHVPEALLITDPSYHLLLMNPAAERLLGKGVNLIGTHLADLFTDPEDFALIGSRLNAVGEAGEPATAPITARLRAATGDVFPGEVIAASLSTARGLRTGVVVLARDMTSELRREEALMKSQRLEAIGQLTGGIAHDFNNLLTIVTGNLELLEMYLEDDRARDHARRAQQAAEAGARLTSRLLTFARRRRLEPQVVLLNDQVRLMMELLQRTLGEQIQLTTVLAPDLWPVRVDPSEVENAVVNLAINGRDALQSGGRLVIETSNLRFDGQAIGPESALIPGDYVRLSVSDNGAGMSKDVLARAFEPFFTTKAPGRGTGLGLSTIYGFVKQSNGNVTIYSEPGKGTTVNIYLPRHATAEDRATKRAEPLPSPARTGGETILVVEDNPEVRVVAVARLERLGYRVIETTTAAEAIAQLSAGAEVHAVFSDVVMPGGLSGFDLAEWIAQHRRGLPVVLTSGFAEDIAREQSQSARELPLLRKPYTQTELAKILANALSAPKT